MYPQTPKFQQKLFSMTPIGFENECIYVTKPKDVRKLQCTIEVRVKSIDSNHPSNKLT